MDYQTSEYLIPVFDFGIFHLEVNTMIFILVVFAITTAALNWLLFRPVLRSLENRAQLLRRIRSASRDRLSEIERLSEAYRANLASAREEINRHRQEGRQQAAREVNSIISHARRQADQELNNAMTELEHEARRVRAELMAGVEPLAERITDRVLER